MYTNGVQKMRKKGEKQNITLYMRSDLVAAFKKRYPSLMSRFCEKALILAISSKQFFEDVFFDEED